VTDVDEGTNTTRRVELDNSATGYWGGLSERERRALKHQLDNDVKGVIPDESDPPAVSTAAHHENGTAA
jgi:hypothetical protein